jgi:HSP20 family molecular chaperone IbpA
MKNNKPLHITLTAALMAVLASVSFTEARRYGGSLLAPRRYDYHRPLTDLSEFVEEMFRAPIYLNMQEQANRLARTNVPRYSVTEDSESGITELAMELPGVLAKDLTVELEDERLLRIKGVRRYRVGKGGSQVEESHFDQAFQMNEGVDPERLTVTLSAGILRVQVPKKEKVVKQIPISTDVVEEEDIAVIEAAKVMSEDESPEDLTVTED